MQALRPRRQFLHQLSKHGAQTGCMFSVLKATEPYVESHRKKKRRPVFDKYAAAVASFVESYIAANQIYPKISEVVQKTGGNRSTIRRILNELNLEENAVRCKEVCVKGGDDMKVTQSIHSLSECMPSNIINSKNSASPCCHKFEQLAQEVESAQVEASINSTDTETDTERVDISAQNLEKKGFSVLRDPAMLTLLNQAIHSSNKADANRRVAPLMEVLQQKSSGSSRRVHLSACGGIENDLSWDKNLRSIMPTSIDGNKEDTSGFQDERPKVNTENMEQASSSSEQCKEGSRIASDFVFTTTIVSSKPKSKLSKISGANLLNALKCQEDVLKDLKNIKLFRRMTNTKAHAILQFKTNESMQKALKLKSITIAGEHGLAETVDFTREGYTKPAGLGERSVFQEVLQGMAGSLKKKNMSSKIFHFPTHPCVEDKKSGVCMQSHPISHPSVSQTITIQDCPCKIPLESIERFFSIFGKVQTYYGASTLGTNPSVQIFVKFENASDKEKTMKVQQFTVDGCSFVLRPASSLVVRLKCKESGTDPKAVATACKQYGVVEKLYMRKSQIIDVTFGAKERHRIDELLTSLRGDTYIKEKWDFLPVYEGYTKAQPCHKEKVKKMVVVLKELIIQLTGLIAMEDETSNELAADVESTSAARKVV